jgi:hypothetical protein
MGKFGINWIMAITAAISACGKDDGKGSQGTDQPNLWNPSQQTRELPGSWQGAIKDKRDNAPLRMMPATITFKEDKTFLLTIDDNPTAGATGTYAKFTDSILFRIVKSSLSTFGLSQTQRDLSFTQIGDTLVLFDEVLEIKLEAVKRPSTQEPPGDVADTDPQLGTWVGKDAQRNSWTITINRKLTFDARVENSASSALILSGTYEILKDGAEETVSMSVVKTNNPDTASMLLETQYQEGAKALQVTVFDTAGGAKREVQRFSLRKA